MLIAGLTCAICDGAESVARSLAALQLWQYLFFRYQYKIEGFGGGESD